MDVDIISSRDLLPVVAVVTAVGGEQPFRQVHEEQRRYFRLSEMMWRDSLAVTNLSGMDHSVLRGEVSAVLHDRWSLSGSSQAYLSYDWCKVFPSPFKVIGSEKFRAHAQ
ncbi:hypothetical protein Anapl_15237 [Anas platyrhynchos]|uniref:Uncharacterized protein n=1 Tax=Anas platyrhynchos TaxID=8839 RepID=R0KIY2_ANAPL|nr:hypothetical protein Anapl_15237 [Anas platyrhynchos]